LAEFHYLATREQAARIDVGRERAGLTAHFEQGDAGDAVRQVGAGLRNPLLVLRDRRKDFSPL